MPGRFHVETFGCQMNVHDSHRIEEHLEADGWQRTDDVAHADLVVVNTCSVREKAEHKLHSRLGALRALRADGRRLVLAVTGCVAQREGADLLRRAPFVDVVLGPDNLAELPARARAALEGAPSYVHAEFDIAFPRFLRARPRPGEPTAYVTVMKGCDERCTFCVVPSTRGPQRDRPSDDIVEEVGRLVDAGCREVTLLGQTVNAWREPGSSPDGDRDFAWLLRRIANEVPALRRLRYTSPHPRHLSSGLCAAHGELEVLAAHVHLPVQSGSDRILRRMKRRHDRADYLERLRRLREARPGLTVSTDFIVGFPGETEDDFAQTLALVDEAGFVAAFAFKYSPRPGTAAPRLDGAVPEPVKEERLARLLEAVERRQRAHLASLVGTRQRVLVEGPSKTDPRRASGRTHRNEIVHVELEDGSSPHALVGRLIEVHVESAGAHSLFGRPVERDATSVPRETRRVRLPLLHEPVA
ncbi:MAG: tRNA (N6-isopentenyl adenosine(37)-C2)-methylthiotransferase MiaB [Myxococcota bacterium]|nr:tRNA (N6-isopentenyl adenosine(37)-C2)-methylthiotransferase MiaB [Myxococcota bacterium]MDW8361432.1 tRNA (N6-isopentenyl adenosine(37)-C2)-methylthiotransferase MiaB [Myxococcales bacterium]